MVITVEVEGKKYDLKRRMSRYELELVKTGAKKYVNWKEVIEKDPQKAEEIINSTTPDEEKLIDMVVANCTGMEQDKVYKEMEFVHEVLLLMEILRVSVPEESIFLPSGKPSIATPSTSSTK